MNTYDAYMRAQAARREGARHRVFDWDKAAQLIRDRKPKVAKAGLGSDWEYTGGEIYRDGTPVDCAHTYVYLASNWAIPELDMDGEIIGCWRYQDESPGWVADTYWPESSRKILEGGD